MPTTHTDHKGTAFGPPQNAGGEGRGATPGPPSAGPIPTAAPATTPAYCPHCGKPLEHKPEKRQVICAQCRWHHYRGCGPDLSINHVCRAPAVQAHKTPSEPDTVTGEVLWTYPENLPLWPYYEDDGRPWCSKVNTNGDCPHFQPKPEPTPTPGWPLLLYGLLGLLGLAALALLIGSMLSRSIS